MAWTLNSSAHWSRLSEERRFESFLGSSFFLFVLPIETYLLEDRSTNTRNDSEIKSCRRRLSLAVEATKHYLM